MAEILKNPVIANRREGAQAFVKKNPSRMKQPGLTNLVSLTGFEPAAFCSGGRRSNPLS